MGVSVNIVLYGVNQAIEQGIIVVANEDEPNTLADRCLNR